MDQYKKYIPHVVAVILFIIVTAVFFKPAVMDGKRVRQGDIQHHEGMSKEIADFRKANHKEPLWTNSMFGGMPAYQISVLYPSNVMNPIQLGFSTITRIPFPITSILLSMIGFYFLLIGLQVNPWVSVGGAIAFGLTSYMITLVPAGHNSKMYAISYMAPVLLGVLLSFRGKLWLGAGITALALALEINANHLQITYYLLILLLFVGIGETIRLVREKQVKKLGMIAAVLGGAVIVAILPNLGNLLLTSEYGKYTTRGPSELTLDADQQTKTDGLPIEYATQWCYTKSETFTLMIPDFMGGASQPIGTYDKAALDAVDPQWKQAIANQSSYFGEVIFTSGPYYVGAIICFLFVLGMFIVKDNIKWWLFGATVLAIMLSWGSHFIGLTEFFFKAIPGYNKFRAVSMILVIVDLTMPLLAMLTIRDLMKDPSILKTKMRQFYIAFALTGGISLLVWMTPSTFVDTVNDRQEEQITKGILDQGGQQADVDTYLMNLEAAREAVVKSDAGRSFFLILLTAGLIWFFSRKPFNANILAGAVAVLIVGDLWSVGTRYIDNDNYEKSKKKETTYFASNADKMILQDKDPSYRVLNISVDTWQDASTSYFHKSIGGYHGAKLKRIQELYEQVMDSQIEQMRKELGAAFNAGPAADSLIQVALENKSTLNMMNAKYIIYNPDGGVIENKSACGGAWFVNEVKVVPNADAEITAVKTFNPHTTAIVDTRFSSQVGNYKGSADATATIKVVSHAPDKIVYESNAAAEKIAVFSEVYYPAGWKATIDGKETEFFCANYVQRGVKVPAGKHTIVFEFHPDSYYTGENMAMIGSILVFVFLIGGVYLQIRANKKKAETTETQE